jgi:hypothetical protein
MAVRLVGLYYLPTKPNNYLSLVFRCIMRGGDIKTSEESLRVGFFKSNPLPQPMLDMHTQRVQRSLAHVGGRPYWGTNQLSTRLRLGNCLMNGIVYPWLHFRRKRAGLPPYKAPPNWRARAAVIMFNGQGEVLWTRDKEKSSWILPGGSAAEIPPWETAVRSLKISTGIETQLSGLSGVYPAPDKPEMTFCFSGEIGHHPALTPARESAFFVPGQEPDEAEPQHAAFVRDASDGNDGVTFRLSGTA